MPSLLLFNAQTMHIKSLDTQEHCKVCFPKKLVSSRDSNPDLLVPEADAMSTEPRRQGMRVTNVVQTKMVLFPLCQNTPAYYNISAASM
jgi:hypothetical protein